MADVVNLAENQRAKRKLLITVAEWGEGENKTREILGVRTEDSSIEFNADIETMTDILGITYSDVNKTEPQQTFDPYYLIGGSALGAYLASAVLENDINKYNNCFDIYVIAGFIGSEGAYKCVKHKNCSIIPTSIGGDAWVAMPIELHYSNNIVTGTVDKIAKDFTFTEVKDLSINA